MTDIEQANREVAEALGVHWYEHLPHLNPDFSTDAGKVELMRLMRAREDWWEFFDSCDTFRIRYHRVVSHITEMTIDTTGKLLFACRYWLRKGEKK
jgi:hypothetical protein